MKLLATGNVKMNEADLEAMKARGFYVSMHTPQYANSISVWAPDGTEFGFHCWIDNLEFYVSGERVAIENKAHLKSCLNMMDSILKFNSFRPE
jgi:hypothetical protein